MHPLAPNLQNLSDQELFEKTNQLTKRILQCQRIGPYNVIPQLQMLLQDYQSESTRRHQKQLDEMMAKNKKDFDGIIDIG